MPVSTHSGGLFGELKGNSVNIICPVLHAHQQSSQGNIQSSNAPQMGSLFGEWG